MALIKENLDVRKALMVFLEHIMNKPFIENLCNLNGFKTQQSLETEKLQQTNQILAEYRKVKFILNS